MPETEQLVNTTWLVGITGMTLPLRVQAAYIHQPHASAATVMTLGSPLPAAPVVLKDADHKVVFQGNPEHVQYVHNTARDTGAEWTLRTPKAPDVAYWSKPGEYGTVLSAVRCPGCKERIPVDCPERELETAAFGIAFEKAIMDATAQARRECPGHDVIRLGQQ